MKKRLLMLLTLAILLVGCGDKEETDNTTTDNQTTTETPSTDESTTGQNSTPEAPTPTEDSTTPEEPTELPHEHAYTETVTTEATCETDGVKTFTCDCGDSYTETIEAMEHNYETVADSEVSATCTNDGKEADTKCSLCNDMISGAVIPALSHSYGDYVYNNDATTQKDGTETATCSACGKKNTRTKAGTKLEPETHWYDGYERYVWYDMGEYFFMIVNTQDEVIPYTNSFPYHQTLQERYPNRAIIQNGSNIITPSYSVALISALYMDPEKGFPIWSIDYLWN